MNDTHNNSRRQEEVMREYRKLYASIVVSEKLATVPMDARWLWVLLLVSQDDEGKYPWTPTRIKALTVGTNWSNKDVQNLATVLTESQLIYKHKEWMYISKGIEKNGKPTSTRGFMVYDTAQAVPEQCHSSAEAVLEQRQSSAGAALRVEESRVEKSRGEENPRAVDEIFRQKMRERFGSIITGLDARIDDALEYDMNRSPSKRAKNVQQFVRNWLLKDVDRITAMKENTNGRVQQVNERKLRGSEQSWSGWDRKPG
jgi:hypothetical protein